MLKYRRLKPKKTVVKIKMTRINVPTPDVTVAVRNQSKNKVLKVFSGEAID